MLTFEDLMQMKPHSIFAYGVVKDSPEGINIMNSGRTLKWVACRGGIHDWAIYVYWHDETSSYEWVMDHGDKVHSEQNIKYLVPCTDEAFAMYRH